MITPSGWKFKRPGILIPVFFLSLSHGTLTSQTPWPGTESAALGGAMVCSRGYMCASQNQAGLAFIEHTSLTMQQSWPYLLKELGISSLTGQFHSSRGALGISLSTCGLKGLRQSSLWLSYGLRLHPNIGAGLGMHLWASTIAEQVIHAPGISFALGLQIRLQEQWILGTRLFHPAAWTAMNIQAEEQGMAIELGLAYSFFKIAWLYLDLHMKAGTPPLLCGGIEWVLKQNLLLRTGICSRPFTFSWGVSLPFKKWVMDLAFRYWASTGLSQQTALSYVW